MILVRGFVVCAALACAYRIAIFDLVCYFNLSKVDACTDDDGVDDLSLGMHRHMNGRETYTQCIFHLIILKGTFRLCVLTLTLCLHPSLCVCIPHSVSAHLTLCLHPSLCVCTPHSVSASLTLCLHTSLCVCTPHSVSSPVN
jgi:hypothetical protein